MILRFKRLLNQSDVLWPLLFTVLRMGAGVIVLPLALRTIPTAEMGIYYTFMGLSTLAMLLDFGMVGTIGRSAAYAWGGATSFTARGLPEHSGNSSPNRSLLASLTHVTRSWYYILAAVAGILLAIFGTAFIDKRIQESGLDPNLSLCWLFFSFVTAYGLGTSFWSVLLTGIGDVKTVGRYGVISQVISITLLVTGLLLGLKVWAYAISLFVGPAIDRYLARRRFIQTMDHPMPSLLSRPDFVILAQLWPMTWRMGVSILGVFLMQRGGTLIASAYLGLETTAKYGLTLNLLTIIFQISGMALYVANPRIAQAQVQRNTLEVRRLFLPRIYGGLAVAVVGASILIGFSTQIMNLIGSQTGLLPAGLACILFVILLLDNHQNAYTNLVIASNENPFVIPTLVSSCVMIGLAIWAAPRFGVIGLLLCHGLVQLSFNHWWPVLRGIRLLKRTPAMHPLSMSASTAK